MLPAKLEHAAILSAATQSYTDLLKFEKQIAGLVGNSSQEPRMSV